MGHFSYNALEADSIRLLTLHPGTRDDPISCTLFHTPIEGCQYQALSYEWGDEGNVGGTITVNGLLLPRHLQRNLECALREIRSETANSTLWIDVICINQDDVTEKGHQVARMGQVFRKATSVIAWIGPEADGSETAMDLIADETTLQERAERRELSDTEMAALTPIAYRSYWSRVWIIQEFFLAKGLEIRCGTKTISYDQFTNYLGVISLPHSQFRDLPWKRGPNDPPTHTHMYARLAYPPDPDAILFNARLFSWLRRSYDCKSQASNPRDYIYALLGVSDDYTPGDLELDYDSREETVRDALLKVIPICLKSMPPKHRKYSHRLSRAEFLVKYAGRMGIAINAELQREIAKSMYVKSEDLDLEESMGSEYGNESHIRNMSGPQLKEMIVLMEVAKLMASRGQPFSSPLLYHAFKRMILETPELVEK